MGSEWLYGVSQWIVLPVTTLIIYGAAEGGRLFARKFGDQDPETRKQITTFEAALVGLLSLMIGFTFSLALSQFEARKDAVMVEANAISTVAQRASLLEAKQAAEAAPLARQYLDARLAMSPGSSDEQKLLQDTAALDRIVAGLWRVADEAFAADTRSAAASLFAQAVNALSDAEERRTTADRNHVAAAVFFLLGAIAFVVLGFAGYASGLAGARRVWPAAIMALVVASIITLVMDLDRPGEGLVKVSQQPLLDVRADLNLK
ncbi:MAG TPA: hypothetical protein VIJ85_02670 [Rhizomicrobium sp.]